MSDEKLKADLIKSVLKKRGMLEKDKDSGKKQKPHVWSFELEHAHSDELVGAIAHLKKSEALRAVKLALDEDPTKATNNAYIYKSKGSLVPNSILKNIRDSEELIGGIILPLKANQISLFGRPRPNRFDVGFTVNLKPHVYLQYSDEQVEKLKQEVIPQVRDLIQNCGKTTGISGKDRITFSQFLKQITEDVFTYGWWAVEVRRDALGNFHSFRAIDAGTIYHAVPQKDESKEMEAIRKKAREVLTQLDNHKIPIEEFSEGQYAWVQVIDNVPYQVFTDDQVLVGYLNPSTDITRYGYPVSPMERVLDSITMHINLTTHNKMFFINGRAARSMLVFKSDVLDEEDITAIRQQMTNHINSANASWRMPVFGLSVNDEVSVVPLDGGSRDMEFTYLADLNKRMILATFQVAPEEISALSYLSRGTNSQALAESNNEWKLLKSQQSALRPLLNAIEDFINLQLLPKINKEWGDLVAVYFEGLDADTPEKEASLISQATALYYTFNDILDRVEKERVQLGGDFPLNAAYLQILEKYFTMGEILETFQPDRYRGASKDPRFQFYISNPSWFQYQNLLMQQEQLKQQQQMMQQQQAAQQMGEQQKQDQDQTQDQTQMQGKESEDQGSQQNLSNEQRTEDSNSQTQEGQQLQQSEEVQSSNMDSAVAQLNTMLRDLSKAEKDLPANRKKLLLMYKKAKNKILKDFDEHSKIMTNKLLEIIKTGKTGHDHE